MPPGSPEAQQPTMSPWSVRDTSSWLQVLLHLFSGLAPRAHFALAFGFGQAGACLLPSLPDGSEKDQQRREVG